MSSLSLLSDVSTSPTPVSACSPTSTLIVRFSDCGGTFCVSFGASTFSDESMAEGAVEVVVEVSVEVDVAVEVDVDVGAADCVVGNVRDNSPHVGHLCDDAGPCPEGVTELVAALETLGQSCTTPAINIPLSGCRTTVPVVMLEKCMLKTTSVSVPTPGDILAKSGDDTRSHPMSGNNVSRPALWCLEKKTNITAGVGKLRVSFQCSPVGQGSLPTYMPPSKYSGTLVST
mmetsp:Transcript_16258/g.44537  ORF Transcript_16258/g.44537 Transcript_16258/m.44537 type:complete len:230 (+) Transcript_16258:50-739(+)